MVTTIRPLINPVAEQLARFRVKEFIVAAHRLLTSYCNEQVVCLQSHPIGIPGVLDRPKSV
jgi:hypothetical protein